MRLLLTLVMVMSIFATAAAAQKQDIVESKFEQAHRHDLIGPLLEAGARYRHAEFSYAELLATQEAIWNSHESRYRLYGCIYAQNISGGYIAPHVNRVVIGIIDYNERMIAGFRRYVYDSPMVLFQQMGPFHLNGRGSMPFATVILTGFLLITIGIATIIVNKMIQLLTHFYYKSERRNWRYIVTRPLCKAISILAGCISIPTAILTVRVFLRRVYFPQTSNWRAIYTNNFWMLIIILALLLLVAIGASKLGKASEAKSKHLDTEVMELVKKMDEKQNEIDSLRKQIEDIRNDLRREPHP